MWGGGSEGVCCECKYSPHLNIRIRGSPAIGPIWEDKSVWLGTHYFTFKAQQGVVRAGSLAEGKSPSGEVKDELPQPDRIRKGRFWGRDGMVV